jgi:hypothetical protein
MTLTLRIKAGSYDRVWPVASNSRRKRFCAWHSGPIWTLVNYFPTRRAAHDWLAQIKS